MNSKTGVLYIVATPIGNLADIGIRASDILTEVELILAEDTRHAAKLLNHYGISTRTRSYHDHNEAAIVEEIVALLRSGMSLALISDAGTPLISDPGYKLVRAARENGFTVSPIPGPSALTAAISAAGLATDRFCFEGFLPSKKTQRVEKLSLLVEEKRTMIFYESSHRILHALEDMSAVFGAFKEACVARELSKKFESFYFGSLGDLVDQINESPSHQKGEFVIVVSGNENADENWAKACSLVSRLTPKFSVKDASKIAAETFGVSKNRLYSRLLELDTTKDC